MIYPQKFIVNGYLKDANTSESLIGATVICSKNSIGTTTNVHGFYSLTLQKDSIKLLFSYVGYQPVVVQFLLNRDTVIDIGLSNAMILDEIVVNSTRTDPIHESSKMSSFSIPIEQVKSLPSLFGEIDILKIIQLVPGVQSGNEGTTGFYVRGGGPDQNLILLDGVPLYNVSHLFGFFSIFNASAINHVELTKGGFPARYGGRISSVLDINMKDGNMKEIKGEGSIGLISARAMMEGPIAKDKTSFIVSARRTYLDALAQPFIQKQTEGTRAGYYFYDLNLKVNHIVNSKNRIYSSVYLGSDNAYAHSKTSFVDFNIEYSTQNNFNLKWGNTISALKWNHVFGKRLFSNTSATYSGYHFDVSQRYDEVRVSPNGGSEQLKYGTRYFSGIRDWSCKIDFDFSPNPNHFIRFGTGNIWHRFSPGVYSYNSLVDGNFSAGADIVTALEFSSYAEDDWKISERLKLNAGFHGSAFSVEDKLYPSLQPRLSSRYLLTDNLSLKASFCRTAQFIHLLTNAGTGLPTDLWVPSTNRIQPQQASQIAVGLAKTHLSQLEVSLEGYYKKMNNLIEYKDGASYLNVDRDWQDNVVSHGIGRSYGIELLLQKKSGPITGWIGYTLSKTTRQFSDLNFGKEFPYKYDRRHDVSVALSHEWSKGMDFSLVWVYGTGNAITLPRAVYQGASNYASSNFDPPSVTYFGDRNSYRLKSYNRLDLTLSWKKNKKWGQRKWTVGVYNAYNRLNPFFVNVERDNSGNYKLIQYSLFPIIPSVTYGFKF